MNVVLLSWNPGKDNDHAWTPESWREEMVKPNLEGKTVSSTWGVGRHVNIDEDDTAMMYRQGGWGRGVIARGTIRTRPRRSTHSSNARTATNYVEVDWQESVPTELAVEVEELEMIAPGFSWRAVYSSGRRLPEDVGAALVAAWDAHVGGDHLHR